MPLSDKQRDENDRSIRIAKSSSGNPFGSMGQQGVEDLLARILEVQMQTLEILEAMKKESGR